MRDRYASVRDRNAGVRDHRATRRDDGTPGRERHATGRDRNTAGHARAATGRDRDISVRAARMREDGTTARPVFVDRSGRRRRIAVALGSILGMVLLTVLGVFTAGLFGASVTLPGLPDVGGNGGPAGGSAGPVATQRVVLHPTPTPPSTTAGGVVTAPTGATTTRGRGPSQTPIHPTKK